MNNAAPVGPLEIQESERLATLASLKWLDAPAPEALEAVARMAAQWLQCPVACINLVDTHRLYALASHGLSQRHASRAGSWCDRTIAQRHVLEQHGQEGDRWMFYAGVPIVVQGLALGTLCVMDSRTRQLSPDQAEMLSNLATMAQGLFEARLETRRVRRDAARVRTASMAGTDWLWETDPEGRLQWVSAGLRQHTGLDPIVEMGLSAKDIYAPSAWDHGESWQRYQQARSRREPFSEALAERVTPRGRMTVSISGAPVFAKDGRFMGYRGASRNVTRQIELEALARQRDQLMREAIENFHAGVMISSPDGRILMANQHWLTSVGVKRVEELPPWPQLLRRLIEAGHYPEASGREGEFFEWRLNQHREDRSTVIRLHNRVIMSRDQQLSDGSILHFSTDITQSHTESMLLAEQQQALRASEARLKAVLEALPDLWFVIDQDGRYRDGHRNHPMLMRPFESLKGQPFGSAVSDELAHAEREALLRAQATGQAQRLEYRLTTRDGIERQFEGRMSPMPDGQTLFLTRDMTEVRALERDVRTLQQVLQADLSLGLIVMDATVADHRILYATPGTEAMLGIDVGKLMGRGLVDCLRKLGRNDTGLDLLGRSMQEGLPCVALLTREMEAGRQHRTLEVRLTPLKGPQGQRTHQVALLYDVTDRQLAAERLRLSEERWKFALEGAGDGVWDWDVAADQTYYSQQLMAMLGASEQEFMDNPLAMSQRVHPDDHDRVMDAFNELQSLGSFVRQLECRLRRNDGTYIWVLVRGKVMARDAGGTAARIVGTISDISPLKEAERAKRDQQAAETASRAKSEFLSRMSHEVRTPLNAVHGFAQLAQKAFKAGPSAPDWLKLPEHILHIVNSSQHLRLLVDEVLDLQRIESGAVQLKTESVHLPAVVEHVAQMLQPQAERFGVTVLATSVSPCTIRTDLTRLRQVLGNLVSNAIKYNRPGGQVNLTAHVQQDGLAHFSVTDTGLGMSQDQQARLFQPFERLGRDTTAIEGSGLGLVIARSLVDALGGTVSIHSELDRGTCISFTVRDQAGGSAQTAQEADVRPDPASMLQRPATTDPTPSEAAPIRPLRVMYVEDNRINALLFEEALRGYPQFQLEVADDGDMAMSIAREFKPDVLVVDAHLPGMSGFEVLRSLRTLPHQADTPAYMCSADAQPEDKLKAQQAGFVGYWTKPVDIPAVLDELDRLARLKREQGDNPAP